MYDKFPNALRKQSSSIDEDATVGVAAAVGVAVAVAVEGTTRLAVEGTTRLAVVSVKENSVAK